MSLLNQLAQVSLGLLCDRDFCRLQYFRHLRRWPSLENPQTFNEQVLWLKVNYRNPLLHTCADKYTVRQYVEEQAGSEYLIPLIGVFQSVEEIDFDKLPDQFALKVSHGSGWNILCADKNLFDIPTAQRRLRTWLRKDFYRVGREWAYRGLTPRIVCEKYLAGPDGQPPWDYKFHCFAGEPRYVQVDYGRFTQHTRALYDIEWNRLPCQLEYAVAKQSTPPPQTLETMISLARSLSRPFPYVRVDLYELGQSVFFGELTFYPGKGVERFTPFSFDYEWGKWLRLRHGELKAVDKP
jgi:hypothetical protein